MDATTTDMQMRVEGSLCEVDPDDVVSDLVSRDGTVSVHVFLCSVFVLFFMNFTVIIISLYEVSLICCT